MIHNEGRVFAPEVKFVWDGVSLGIAVGIYAIVVTVIGVLLATAPWWVRTPYAIACVGGLGVLIGSDKVRRRVMGAIKQRIVHDQ